ncbi:hypothetical protein L0U85_01835 [Glycomyces sp. L485]|uniref:hypothetical protein n=1 Tax=Glycomyces sp. L485 TaxID=2909235 RepID=UPI001F4B5909|nr:hypothetical protein [Glycomyces sp. L485]MCH7229608.1 hypothetical protein [Glycomyces sp. L485]
MITLDNGHPASYDHEAEDRYNAADGTVTLDCECGWSATAAFADGHDDDDIPASLAAEWKRHVYAATGQARPELDEATGPRDENPERGDDQYDDGDVGGEVSGRASGRVQRALQLSAKIFSAFDQVATERDEALAEVARLRAQLGAGASA